MAEVIRMPRLSDTMEEGNIVSWQKKVGDSVKAGDVLAEVETDKATMELESYFNGYMLYIAIESGAVPVDGIIAVIGNKDEEYKHLLTEDKTKTATTAPVRESVQEAAVATVIQSPAASSTTEIIATE
ncbi:MAG TPA: dihydrolipoamide acyltransferase, partial [Saprospiraceae bacterium]|nr:dihydrolipoamide acyltransferase [Saprospiraceae bacterium]